MLPFVKALITAFFATIVGGIAFIEGARYAETHRCFKLVWLTDFNSCGFIFGFAGILIGALFGYLLVRLLFQSSGK